MKRKISSFVTALFILMVCVFASACGNKYKNLEFKVYYAFSENASVWHDGTNGISLNYVEGYAPAEGEEPTSLVLGADLRYHLFIKVEVGGVKAKHVGTITISSPDLTDLGSKMVKEGEVVNLSVGAKENATIKFYENNSGKRGQVKLSVYSELKSIEVRESSSTPAMIFSSDYSLNLLELNNLIYNPVGLTNQTGVTYSVESIGKFSNLGAYEASGTVNAEEYLYVDNGRLRATGKSMSDTQFEGAHVAKIVATSIFHNGEKEGTEAISAEFYVYLVESSIGAPQLSYTGVINDKGSIVDVDGDGKPEVNIYKNGGLNYSTATLAVSNPISIYSNADIYLNDGTKAKIKPTVYVGVKNTQGVEQYQEYKFGEGNNTIPTQAGLLVENDSNNYTFSIFDKEDNQTNKVKFAFEINGLDFSCCSANLGATEFEVEKGVLPTEISINATGYTNGDVANGWVYGTNLANYHGTKLTISANPNDDPNRKIILTYPKNTLEITKLSNGQYEILNSGSKDGETIVKSGDSIYVKFLTSNTTATVATITMKTVNTPKVFNATTITEGNLTISYQLTKRVTANSLTFVNEDLTEAKKYLFATNKDNNYIYVRADYVGGELDSSTVKLISQNENVVFGNGLTEIALDTVSFTSSTGVKIFKVPVKSTDKALTTKLTVVAGEGELELEKEVEIETVYTLEDLEDVAVLTSDESVKTLTSSTAQEDVFSFAIPNNQRIEFKVALPDGVEIKAIQGISFDYFNFNGINRADYNYNASAVNLNTISSSVFEATANLDGYNYFAILEIKYYDTNLVLQSKKLVVQFAVYSPISKITNNITGNSIIGYINDYYTNISSTMFNFDTKTSQNATPTNQIKIATFNKNSGDWALNETDLELVAENISQVQITLSGVDSIKDYIKVSDNKNVDYKIDNSNPSLIMGVEADSVDGEVKVELTNNVENSGVNKILINLTAISFGEIINVTETVRINLGVVNKADRIVVNDTELGEKGEITLSFMDVEENDYARKDLDIELQFDKPNTSNSIQFNDVSKALTYIIYKYDLDLNGNYTYDEAGNINKTKMPNTYFGATEDVASGIIKAYKNIAGIGGKYHFVLATKDSFIGTDINNIEETDFENTLAIEITITDGTIYAPYQISSAEDLALINNNLDGYYELVNNIDLSEIDFEPIGLVKGNIKYFNGVFNGQHTTMNNGQEITRNYSITIKLKETLNSTSYNELAGLFAVVGESGVVKNLDLKVKYNLTNATYNNVGAIAGINFGAIENVNLHILNNEEVKLSTQMNFGGLVGLNETTGKILNSTVTMEDPLVLNTTNAQTYNIGLMTGVNAGKISGKYLGNESLNNFTYDVVARLSVVNSATTQSTINLGGIAGLNSGTIEKMLIGGTIDVEQLNPTESEQTGYVGGVAGLNESAIATVTALSLNIKSTANNINVAGVAGSSNGSITYAKYVTAQTKFNKFNANGQIEGTALVAGIVAKANAGATINYSSVESFVLVQLEEATGVKTNYPTLIGGTTTAGLVANGSANINNSFVNSNLQGANLVLLANGFSGNGYFIGNATSPINTDSTYFVLFDYVDNILKNDQPVDTTGATGENWATQEGYNKVGGVNYPYIIKDGNPLMIVAPQSVTANLNQTYKVEEGHVFVVKFDISKYEANITETIVVNYFNNAGDAGNTHNILSVSGNGLVDIETLPDGAQGGLRYEIIAGNDYAYINNQNQIVFIGASKKNIILVRAYSVFNPEVEIYFAFYSMNLLTELSFGSTAVYYDNDGANMSLYTGMGGQSLKLTAENIKDGENLSVLNVNDVKTHLIVESSSDKLENSKLTIQGTTFDNLSVEITGEDIPADYYELITFKLYLNKEYYSYLDGTIKYPTDDGNDATSDHIKLAEVKLKVYLYNVATGISIDGNNETKPTNQDIEFTAYLTTDYLSSTPGRVFTEETLIYEVYNAWTDANEDIIQDKILTVNGEHEASDAITLKFEVVEGKTQVEKLLKATGEKYFADLFNIHIERSLYVSKDSTPKTLGYAYVVNLELKDEFAYRYITENIKFKTIVGAVSNFDVGEYVETTFKPTMLESANVKNYAVNSINMATDYTNVLTHTDQETSIVQPGSLGNIMMINLQPEYANVASARITSSELYVPTLSKNVVMKFTQLVIDERYENQFATILAGNTQVGKTLELDLVSRIKTDGTKVYTGVIYVYIQLEKFYGLEANITATLEVDTTDNETNKTLVRARQLLTTYRPTTEAVYETDKLLSKDNYLIQKGTDGNVVQIKVFGYQFNSNPVPEFGWNLDSNGNVVSSLTKDGNTYLIGDYITYYLDNSAENAIYNELDGSYTIKLKINVSENIPASFVLKTSLTLVTKDGQLDTGSNTIYFNPVDYYLTSAEIENIGVAINESKNISLRFETENENNLTAQVLTRLLETYNTQETVANLFSYFSNGEVIKLGSAEKHPEFSFVYDDTYKTMSIVGASTFNSIIDFEVNYGYAKDENGLYSLVFGSGNKNDDTGNYEINGAVVEMVKYLSASFNLNVAVIDTVQEKLIYSAEDIYDNNGTWKLEEGGYYVLMNDIELENVVPITTNIARFDGNNRVISIKSFKVDDTTSNYGLFAQIGTYTVTDPTDNSTTTHQTLLKNMIVDYSKFNTAQAIALNNNTTGSVVFGGLVAVNNGGLIYNCDVMNINPTDKTISVLVPSNANVVFGGLVGTNNGVITNSRVGRNSYTKITKTNPKGVEVAGGGLIFEIYNVKQILNETNNQFSIVAGGFVGVNANQIASSFVANTSIINYSTNEETNKTAGFVAENNSGASISYAYVKADDEQITLDSPRATGYVVKHLGNGSVAGFVYTNSGEISNSYANTMLETKSNYISGFVYENNGSIGESYSACTMNAGSVDSYAEQPFIGMNSGNILLSNGTIKNSYYLMRSTTDNPVTQGEKDVAYGLNATNFQNSEYLVGYSFVLTNTKVEREQGIWSYYSIDGKQRTLPELINADMIAHSYRYVVDETAPIKVLTNSSEYAVGTANNPHTISSVEEFNSVFTSKSNEYFEGYVRFINDIDFNDDKTAIQTRTDFRLGSKSSGTKTSVEGNGMTISGIYLEPSKEIVEKIGLFAEIKNAYVKNLNLEFATPTTNGQFSTTTATYSGGLAGYIENGVILNVKLDGANTTLTGENFVGGLAGMIVGNSLIYGVETNVSVKASSTSASLYYDEKDFNALNINITSGYSYEEYLDSLSYAGAVAGVIDIYSRYGTTFNIQYIDVLGYEMPAKTINNAPEANVLAEYAGGVAGYAGQDTTSYRLRYLTGENEYLQGDTAVGGIYGVLLGSVTASQVASDEETQFDYDTELGKYIQDLQDGKATELSNDIGNKNLLHSSKYAGGLVGVAVDAVVRASYSKSSIADGEVIGGLVGTSVASTINYSYAIPYVNLNANMKSVGGLIGASYGIKQLTATQASNSSNEYVVRTNNIKEFERLAKLNNSTVRATDIQFTYSTLIVDNNKLSSAELNDKLKLDYVCADYTQNNVDLYLQSNSSSNLVYVYAGTVNYTAGGTAEVVNQTELLNNGSSKPLYVMFNTTDPAQALAFQEIFSSWSLIKYWSLDEEKYFPLLNDKLVENYIEIANENDIYKISSNLDGNFKIVDDITIDEQESNWVISGTFTGTIVGEVKGDGRRPVIRIKSLIPNMAGTTGFFQETLTATITNVEFEWGYEQPSQNGGFNLSNGTTITMVSGVSCNDTNSLFQNLLVSGSMYSGNNGMFLNTNNKSVGGVAGIVGEGINSNILGCTFAGKIQANMSGGDAYVGGLAGSIKTDPNVTPDDNKQTAIINGSYVGVKSETPIEGSSKTYPTTEFTLTTNNTELYLGGAVGKASTLGISTTEVGSVKYTSNYQNININVTLSSQTENVYIGGLTGYASDGIISNLNAVTNIVVTGGHSAQTLNIGGVTGHYSVGAVGSITGIERVNTKTNISTYDDDDNKLESKSGEVRISTGVAELNAGSTITDCLFNGEINTENSSIETLYAGGVASRATSASIHSTIANAVIYAGTADSTSLYAGGLIGSSDAVTINASASWQRLIPITSNQPINVYAGGLIGEIKTSTSVSNSYTTTSIILDSIAPKAITNLNVGGLVGDIPADAKANGTEGNIVKFENVYYSSDLALCADENYVQDIPLGTNLYTQALLMNASWHNSLQTVEADWCMFMADGWSRMPYVSTLENALKTYGVLIKETGRTYYDYALGSVMRPQELKTTDAKIIFATDYTYYLLIQGDTNNPQAVPTIDGDGKLNGILLGQEDVFVNGGMITEIVQHSAVTNLHITVTTKVTVDPKGSGIIAQTNKGVIFNCSIQGTNIEVGGNSNLGLLTYSNEGLISHCYSSAEIAPGVDDDDSKITSANIAGIVYENKGKLLSNYFTGYIETKASATGIFAIGNDSNSYAYNNYMAGVIIGLRFEKGNNFAGVETNGSNNYIDIYSDCEFYLAYEDANKEAEEKDKTLMPIATASLMSKGALAGEWYTTVETVTVNTNATTFGYNYNYPIYRFNKSNNGNTSVGGVIGALPIDAIYSLNTGKGLNVNSDLKDENDNGTNLDERYSAIVNSPDSNPEGYEDAMKISHLGVLASAMNINADLTIVFIYDIYGYEKTVWNCETAGFKPQTFNGVALSNKYLTFDVDDTVIPEGEGAKPNVDDTTILVTDILGSGLFNDVGNAYIVNISIGNMAELVNSGAIGKTVSGNVYVDNIKFINSTISGTGNLGGLFSTINDGGTLNVVSIFTGESSFDLKLDGVSNIGLYAGINEGTISDLTLTEQYVYIINASTAGGYVGTNKGTISRTLNASAIHLKVEDCTSTAGGVAGIVESGTISLNGQTIYLHSSTFEHTGDTVLGGVAGVAKEGESGVSISQVTIQFMAEEEDLEIRTNSFGGVIGIVEGVVTIGENVEIILGEKDIVFKNSKLGCYGLVVGAIKGGTITLNNQLNIKAKDDLNVLVDGAAEGNADSKDAGVGTLVGAIINGGFIIESEAKLTLENKITLESNGHPNLGGAIGFYGGGALSLQVEFTNSLTISGVNNVGGAIGYACGPLSKEILESNLFSGDTNGKIEIVIKHGGANHGGLIGRWTGTNQVGTEDDPEYVNLMNQNNITITYNQSKKVNELNQKQVSNVGGVVGLLETSEVANLANAGTINYDIGFTATDEEGADASQEDVSAIANAIKDTGATDTGLKVLTQTTNVGGVIGKLSPTKAEGTNIMSLSNSGNVAGYQNIGGLIGLIDGGANIVTLTNCGVSFEAPEGGTTPENLGGEYDSDGVVFNLTSGIEIAPTNSGNVYGVINVGGAIGSAYATETGSITIEKVASSAKVYGNTNVGGLIGFTNKTTLSNNIVKYIEKDTEEGSAGETVVALAEEAKYVEVKAVYYLYNKMTATAETAGSADPTYEFKTTSYIPTSVGGLVGKALNTRMEHNIIDDVRVTSAYEGVQGDTISTISNHMAQAGDNPTVNCLIEGSSDDLVRFDEIETGFGGMIGTIDEKSFEHMGTAQDEINNSSNVLINPTVRVQLGVNVGTYYGTMDLSKVYWAVPTLYGNAKVDGAYQVGGIAGYAKYSEGDSFPQTIKNSNLYGTAQIDVQSTLSGMYVGGLLGKTDHDNISGLNIKKVDNTEGVNITIYTRSNYYIGGLIGRAEVKSNVSTISGSVGEWIENSGNLTQVSGSGNILASGQDDKENFGGFLGMLRVHETAGGSSNVSIKGDLYPDTNLEQTHYFAFTVNTIENSNYQDGQSRFSYDEDDGTNLYAEAFYINQDMFTIAGTKDTTLYDGIADSNPLKSGTHGWSKEYTGFRIMQRNIKQADSVGWDSIGVVYDAKNITHVETLKTAGITTGSKVKIQGNEKTIVDKVEEGQEANQVSKDHILYTVYEETEGQPTLYSAIGIATPFYNYSKDAETVYGVPQNDNAKWWEWVVGFFTETIPLQRKYINLTNRDLVYLDFNKDYRSVDGSTINGIQNQAVIDADGDGKLDGENDEGTVKFLVFKISNYYDGDIEGNSAYFKFETIYDNSTLTEAGTANDSQLPRSGSVFEVAGIRTSAGESWQFNNDSGADIKKWIKIGTIVVDAVVLVATFGIGGAWVAGKQAMKHATKGAIKAFAKAFLKHMRRKIAKKTLKKYLIKGGVTVGVLLVTNTAVFTGLAINAYAEKAKANYFEPSNLSYGFRGSTYAKEVNYIKKGDQWIAQTSMDSSYYDDTGAQYLYYSATRPKDYHISQYVGLQIGENVESVGSEIVIGEGGTLSYEMTGGEGTSIFDYKEKAFYEMYSSSDFTDIGVYNVNTITGGAYTHTERKELQDTIETDMLGYNANTKKLYSIQKKYDYRDGKYYINARALAFDYRRHSLADGEEPLYVSLGGETYGYGSFNATTKTYIFAVNDNNRVSNTGGTYKVNGVTISSDVQIECKDVQLNYIPMGKTTQNHLGYDYFEGAYYAENGTQGLTGETGDLVRYAQFKLQTTEPNFGTEGVDWFTATYQFGTKKYKYNLDSNGTYKLLDNGQYVEAEAGYTGTRYSKVDTGTYSYSDRTGYFVIQNVPFETSDTDISTDINNLQVKEGETTPTVTVKVYPYSFTNPYQSGTAIYSSDSIYDSQTYVYDKTEEETKYVSFAPTYYIYEGGYVVNEQDVQEDLSDNGVLDRVTMIYTPLPDNATGSIKVTEMDDTWKTDEDHDFSKYSNRTGVDLSISNLIADFDNYKNKYYSIDDGAPIADVYYKVGEKLYMYNSCYMLNEDGLLVKIFMSDPNQTSVNGNNENMYLTNKNVQLFTRYRYATYTNSMRYEILDLSSISSKAWGEHKLIPSQNGSTTVGGVRLIESVKVILGGNYSNLVLGENGAYKDSSGHSGHILVT